MNKYKLVIGDWSDDGHGKCEDFLFEVNKPLEEIQQAYRDSVVLTGTKFHHNQDGSIPTDLEAKALAILTDYEEYRIPVEALDRLKTQGLELSFEYGLEDWEDDGDSGVNGPEGVATLIMWFIKLSLPGLEYKLIKDDVPSINGWWGNLNHQFGYGVF